MPVFTYRGTNRAGANVQGERTAGSKAELQSPAAPRADQRQQDLRKGQRIQHSHLRRRRGLKGAGHLHAPVLGHD